MTDPLLRIAEIMKDVASMPRPQNRKQWRAMRDKFKAMARICSEESYKRRQIGEQEKDK